MSIEMAPVQISATVTFLKSIPTEVKTWRIVPQLIFQVLQVIQVRSASQPLRRVHQLFAAAIVHRIQTTCRPTCGFAHLNLLVRTGAPE